MPYHNERVMTVTTTDCKRELEHGQLCSFKDLSTAPVPENAGAYTIWRNDGTFMFVGTSGCLKKWLTSHARGQLGGDRFNVYVAQKLVRSMAVPTVKQYIHSNLGFRFCTCSKAEAGTIRSDLKAGRWPHGKKPFLNPS